MRTGGVIGLVGAVLAAVLCLPSAGTTYALYHESIAGRQTAVVLTNVDDVQASYAVSVYDADGSIIGDTAGALTAYASTVIFLRDVLEVEPGTGREWGLVRIDTPTYLSAASWIGSATDWLTVENTAIPTIDPSRDDYSYYWFTVNYANTETRRTTVAITNPYGHSVHGTLWVYDALGEQQLSRDFVLSPRASQYYVLEEALVVADSVWGMVDVRASAPVLLVAEYLDENGALIDLDMPALYYFVQ
jgi:hypothetical protein